MWCHLHKENNIWQKQKLIKKQWQLETDMFEGQWGWRDRAGSSQGCQHILSRINGKTWKTRLMGNALDWMSRERGSAETGWNTSPAHEGVWGWGMGMPQCKLETPETLCGCRRTKERSMQGIRVSVDKCEICSCAEHLELLWDMCFRS